MIQSSIYRSRQDIIHKILSHCATPSTKTNIMYGTVLSWTQLNSYLTKLLDNKLLQPCEAPMGSRSRTSNFVITKKGQEYLELSIKLDRMLNDEDKEGPKKK